MRRGAAGVVLLAGLVLAGAPGTLPGSSDGLRAGAADTAGFCTTKPKDVDSTVPSLVDALGVSAPDTPPIAILDTGVDGTTPELPADRLVSPFDALGGGMDASDVSGRGTELAGLAAGAPGLVQGVSPTSPIIPVRVVNVTGDSTAQIAASGIQWAAQHGAAALVIGNVAPMSQTPAKDVTTLTQAISQAFNQGTIVVVNVGNEGVRQADFPSALPHVLAVGGTDSQGGRATFSNTGPYVDLMAPASALTAPIPTAYCDSGYGRANGTLFATASVAAAAALLAKLRPELGVQQRFDVLRTTAKDTEFTGRDDETGFGLLDVGAAVKAPVPAKESSPEVDDDPYFVRGAFKGNHPTLLTKSRKTTVTGQVSPAKDPSDVYPVLLKKSERLIVNGSVKGGADSVVELRLWKPAVGDYDVSNDVGKQLRADSGGFSPTPGMTAIAKSTGVYYLSVEAPDVDMTDTSSVVPASEPYTLTLSKAKVKPKIVKKKK